MTTQILECTIPGLLTFWYVKLTGCIIDYMKQYNLPHRRHRHCCKHICMNTSMHACTHTYILLIPRWRKSMNMLLGRESSSSSSSSYCFYMCEILVPRLPSWNCYRLGHCTTHTHRKIRADPTHPSICVHLNLTPFPPCGRHK